MALATCVQVLMCEWLYFAIDEAVLWISRRSTHRAGVLVWQEAIAHQYEGQQGPLCWMNFALQPAQQEDGSRLHRPQMIFAEGLQRQFPLREEREYVMVVVV